MSPQCAALSTPNTLWTFCPSLAGAYIMAILFALTTIGHLVQAIIHRKAYCWVIVMSGTWQLVCYIFRIISIKNPAAFNPYAAWFVLILLAPLWTNAFVYMVMGRMVWNFIPNGKVWGVTPWRFGLYFIVLDIIAALIQIYGAGSASEDHLTTTQVMNALHIYMAGVGIQQAVILLFLVFAFQFHGILHASGIPGVKAQALPLLYTLYIVIALISLRIFFRLAEYASGLKSTIPSHEVYQYCLDSLPMFLALVLLNVVHPGRIMPGRESNIPSRKDRKRGGITAESNQITNISSAEELVTV